MALSKTRFSRELHVAFAALLLITLGLAWYFYDSVKWYEHDVQRIALANDVLQNYQQVSILTFRELNALGERVMHGEALEAISIERRSSALEAAISRVRQAIAAEAVFDKSSAASQELYSLVDIERVIEDMLSSSTMINQALIEGRQDDANAELSRLRSSGAADYFSGLVHTAINQQRREVSNADQDAIELAHYITKVLPVFMSILVVITLLVVFMFSRSLKRSVGALHDGVRAFTGGNLSHRIPDLREREFWRLGEAFNTMARELSDYRKNLHDINVSLEATVEERTRALRTSNRKLANVDINRRKLLADISHEFRTPLTVIRGESEIALRGENKNMNDYRASFKRIMEQADNTTRLVDDLLFIARVDAGEPRLRIQPVAIASMIDATCEEFSANAEQKGISIKQSCEDKKAIVRGDAGRLRQVFAILADNALRYSNHGGSVQVELTRSDTEVCVSFRDNGIGLSEEEAEMAFERFYRGDKAEEHASGTGLGLPVAKAIVEAHNGSIKLEGKMGEGATATVTFPVENRLRVVA
jgi:signal transduction histidine kinase